MLIKGLAPPAAVEDVVNDSLLVFLIDSLVGLHFLEDFVIGRPGVCHLDVCFFSIGIDDEVGWAGLGAGPLVPGRESLAIRVAVPHEVSDVLLDFSCEIEGARVVEGAFRIGCGCGCRIAGDERDPDAMDGAGEEGGFRAYEFRIISVSNRHGIDWRFVAVEHLLSRSFCVEEAVHFTAVLLGESEFCIFLFIGKDGLVLDGWCEVRIYSRVEGEFICTGRHDERHFIPFLRLESVFRKDGAVSEEVREGCHADACVAKGRRNAFCLKAVQVFGDFRCILLQSCDGFFFIWLHAVSDDERSEGFGIDADGPGRVGGRHAAAEGNGFLEFPLCFR